MIIKNFVLIYLQCFNNLNFSSQNLVDLAAEVKVDLLTQVGAGKIV